MSTTFRPFAIGALIGLPIAVVLYQTTPAYADFLNWQFSQPLLLIPAAFIGLAIGYFTD